MAERKCGLYGGFADTRLNSLNRYSMPVTRSRTGLYADIGLDGTNTTRFLFGDEENSGETKGLVAGSTDDNFPTLVRREDFGLVSLIVCGTLTILFILEAAVQQDVLELKRGGAVRYTKMFGWHMPWKWPRVVWQGGKGAMSILQLTAGGESASSVSP